MTANLAIGADPHLKEIITSLDDDKIGKYKLIYYPLTKKSITGITSIFCTLSKRFRCFIVVTVSFFHSTFSVTKTSFSFEKNRRVTLT